MAQSIAQLFAGCHSLKKNAKMEIRKDFWRLPTKSLRFHSLCQFYFSKSQTETESSVYQLQAGNEEFAFRWIMKSIPKFQA